jgi:hypothetical protein
MQPLKLKEGGTQMLIFLCAIQTIYQAGATVFVSVPGIPFWYQLAVYFQSLIPIFGWIYIYLLKKHVHCNVLSSEGKRIIQAGNSAIIIQSVCSMLVLLSWLLTHDECHSEHCLEDFLAKLILLGQIVPHSVGNIAMPIFFTCHDALACLLSTSFTCGKEQAH